MHTSTSTGTTELLATSVTTSPIFIGGAGRSGTSLLRTILNAHSRIAIGAELKATPLIAQFWQQLSQFRPNFEEHFHIRQTDIDDAVGEVIVRLLASFRERSGKPRVGEKTPNNVFVFQQLHRMFPASPLLNVIRDGRDVVSSLLRQQWQTSDGSRMPITEDPRAAAQYWVRAVQAGRKAAQSSASLEKRYHEVRYEDLVRAPEQTARIVFAHLGERWEPEIMSFHEHEASVYQQVHRPISDASIGKWKHGLTPDAQIAVKEVAGSLLIDLGYASGNDW